MAHTINRDAAIRHCIIPATIEPLAGVDRVAEILAQGGSLKAVYEICGYATPHGANSQLQRIRRQLGWQAQ